MFVVKVMILYTVLYLTALSAVIFTDFNNPAISFFVPSIFAMCYLGKVKLANPKVNSFKLTVFTSLGFTSLTVFLAWFVQLQIGWIENSPQLMYFMAAAGNFLFPFMIFPKIKQAQSL